LIKIKINIIDNIKTGTPYLNNELSIEILSTLESQKKSNK